ncbi:SNF2 superfamily protein [Mycena chlorophos]|uniref:SNF2 superfamily protein n=1 Tax=Mycena chlorophos TaxID=658473 RepID=A0A8H6SQU9_MYCCL|nr:SNF2 superfamily protein [Mycena chlorophos]
MSDALGLRALAQRQLGLKHSSTVPQTYLDELKVFVDLYPHDTDFKVTLQPKSGYGLVSCCGEVITLGPRATAPDGGKALGFGSFYAYRTHVNRHPNHKGPRDARLRATGSNASIKREPSANVLHRRDPNAAAAATPSRAIKPEPTEATIPLKRTSGSAFGVKKEETPKKLKRENTNPLLGFAAVEAAQDARDKINEILKSIMNKQSILDRIKYSKSKSKAKVTRMRTLELEIALLRQQKQRLDASIPRVASPTKRNVVKTESRPELPLPLFPKLEDVKPKLEDIKPVIPRPRPAVPSSSRFPGAYDSDSDDDMMDVDPSVNIVNQFANVLPNIAPTAGVDHQDENGDYHGRGRDMFQGPQARADDIDKFLIEAGNAELFDGNETIDKALEKLGLESVQELIPGLEIALMPHQVLGVAWMVANENKKSTSGGMLADEMGLGKTVQMIATIVKNPSKDPKCKTTLILCPLALLRQWRMEIETKAESSNLKVVIYHGPGKPKRKAELLSYDIVLTTYGTMALEWPDAEAEDRKLKAQAKKKKAGDDFIVSDSDDDSDAPKKSKGKKKNERGLLFQVDFYRIVLDEAQNIRNKRTRASRAVTDLNAKMRWCLTATPIINSLADVYGPIRFLRIRPWYDWNEFNSHIASKEKKQPQLAVARLQKVLDLFLLRRMKNSQLDGKKLIELTDKTVELVSLEFSEEEREIYNHFESIQQAKFNRFLREGSVLRNYASVLVLLLRLRQLCSHPALIQEGNASHFLAPGEDDEPAEFRGVLARARKEVSSEFVQKMKTKYKELAKRRIAAEKEAHGDAVLEVDDCGICLDSLTEAMVTPCGHEFCDGCITNFLQAPNPDENAGLKADERPCPACRSTISPDKLFPVAAFEPTDEELNGDIKSEEDSDVEIVAVSSSSSSSPVAPRRTARKSAARKVIAVDSSDEEDEDDDDEDMSDFIVNSDEDEEEKDARRLMKSRAKAKGKTARRPMVVLDSDEEDTPEEKEVLIKGPHKKLTKAELKMLPKFLPSTKMKSMMEYIKTLAEEKPDEKTLVISQWTQCLAIVSDYLKEANIPHVKYQGDMTTSQREKAVSVFMSKEKATVMLMSLKCGGVGLNLTRANNVVSLDLGWSPAIDHQAFDRVHRLGQQRPVIVRRLVISNTVEDRILALQERKQSLADGSLGEGKGKKIGRLSVKELANLFGLDARGRVLAHD